MITRKSWNFSDLTDLPNDLPGGVLLYGPNSVIFEDSSASYFTISNDLLNFDYARIAGIPEELHGTILYHPSCLHKLISVSAIFSDPTKHFISSFDEFFFLLELGFVSNDALDSWIGGAVLSHYNAGIWQNNRTLKIKSVENLVETEIESAETDDYTAFYDLNELVFSIENENLSVILNGVAFLNAEIAPKSYSHSLFRVEFFAKTGSNYESFPIISSLSEIDNTMGTDLRMTELPKMLLPLQIDPDNFFLVPIRELENEKKVKILGDNSWEFLEETLIEPSFSGKTRALKGSIITSIRQFHKNEREIMCKYIHQR